MQPRDAELRQHLNDLALARKRALRKARSRGRVRTALRNTGLVASALITVLITSELLLTGPVAASGSDFLKGSMTDPLDELWIRGAIHIVDSSGDEMAILGRETDDGPIVLGLYPPNRALLQDQGQQTVRLAASNSGAAVSARSAAGESGISLVAESGGPQIELRDGNDTRIITEIERTRGARRPDVAARPAERHRIDLSYPEVQPIGDGFMVSQLNTESTADGVRVSGRIINTTSVRHRNARFRLGSGSSSESFSIGLISPGNSTSFAVLMPGLTPSAANNTSIAYLGSTLNYFDHSLRGVNGEVGEAN